VGITAHALGDAAQALSTVAGELTGHVGALEHGTAELATTAALARRSGSSLLQQLALLDELAASANAAAADAPAIRDAVRGAAENMLVRAGELSRGPVPTVADDFVNGARAAQQAADALNLEAYYARNREGIAVAADAVDSIGVKIDDLVVPSAEAQAGELAELHRLAGTRTPERTVIAMLASKAGNGLAWDEYARLFEQEFGAERATQLRDLLSDAMQRTITASEALKNTMPRTRPFDADATLTTVLHRPDTLSFPSGHAARAEAASTIFQAMWPERSSEFTILSDLVADARPYGGVHYPSDVAAGRILGRRIGEQVLAEAGIAAPV
jgi:hypothetical protein